MKVQCSCGAKYEFELNPAMANNPVKFVCPACGLDASEFVDGLIRRELGQSQTPSGVPIPIALTSPQAASASAPSEADKPAAPATRPPLTVRPHAPQPSPTQLVAEAPAEAAPMCPRHPGEISTARCFVCSKPICAKCM